MFFTLMPIVLISFLNTMLLFSRVDAICEVCVRAYTEVRVFRYRYTINLLIHVLV